MTPKAPVAAKKLTDEFVRDPFKKTLGEVEIELPSLSWIKPGTIRRIRKLSQIDQMYTLFEMFLDPEQLAAIDDLEPDEFEDFCTAWKEHSGVAPGES